MWCRQAETTPTTIVAARVPGTNLLLVAVSARGLHFSINNCLTWNLAYSEGGGNGSAKGGGGEGGAGPDDGESEERENVEAGESETGAGAEPDADDLFNPRRAPDCAYSTAPTQLFGLGTRTWAVRACASALEPCLGLGSTRLSSAQPTLDS